MPADPQLTAGPILIVDDDPLLCDFIAMALGEQGYRTVTAGDGVEALPLIERELPALILTDAGMPQLGGRNFAARVRELLGEQVPCVIISGSRPSKEDREDPDVTAYLPKPFELEDLFRVVKQFARAAETTRAP